MRQIIVSAQSNADGLLDSPYDFPIPDSVKVLGMMSQQLPDGTVKSLLAVRPYGQPITYYLNETEESFRELLEGECCAGGGSGGSGSGGGILEYEFTTDQTDFQDDRLIGAHVPVFILDGTSYQFLRGDFTEDQGTGTIIPDPLSTPPFSTGSVITVFYGQSGSVVMVGSAGSTIVNSKFVGRTITAIIIDGSVINKPADFTKTTNSNTITLTAPLGLAGGESITVIFG